MLIPDISLVKSIHMGPDLIQASLVKELVKSYLLTVNQGTPTGLLGTKRIFPSWYRVSDMAADRTTNQPTSEKKAPMKRPK